MAITDIKCKVCKLQYPIITNLVIYEEKPVCRTCLNIINNAAVHTDGSVTQVVDRLQKTMNFLNNIEE